MKQRCQRNRRNRALERPNVDGIHIRTASVDDAAAIAEIYNQGIEERVATFETERRSADDQRAWLKAIAGRYPAVVAQIDGEIIGWAGAGPYPGAGMLSGHRRIFDVRTSRLERSRRG